MVGNLASLVDIKLLRIIFMSSSLAVGVPTLPV